jgi:DNA polymerase sigma
MTIIRFTSFISHLLCIKIKIDLYIKVIEKKGKERKVDKKQRHKWKTNNEMIDLSLTISTITIYMISLSNPFLLLQIVVHYTVNFYYSYLSQLILSV